MQIFLPYKDIFETAKCLDIKRLNKQIIECEQILNTIDGESRALLQRWLREKHQVDIVIIPTPNNHYTFKLIDIGVEDIERPPYNEVEASDFNTYEACLEAASQEALKMI